MAAAMAVELLLVIVIYAAGAFGVHWAHRRRQRVPARGSHHYVLHVHNDGRRLEWVVRALLWHGLRRDRGIRITVIDEGSTDDTPELLRLLVRTFGIGEGRTLSVSGGCGASPDGVCGPGGRSGAGGAGNAALHGRTGVRKGGSIGAAGRAGGRGGVIGDAGDRSGGGVGKKGALQGPDGREDGRCGRCGGGDGREVGREPGHETVRVRLFRPEDWHKLPPVCSWVR